MSSISELKSAGNDAFKRGDYLKSVEYFTKAIAADTSATEHHVLYSNRSGSLMSLGRYEDALSDANKCVRLKSEWSKGWSRKGAAELALQRFDDSESSYRRSLELDKDNTAARDGLRQVMDTKRDSTQKLDVARLGMALKLPQFEKAMEDESFKEKLDEFLASGKIDQTKMDPRLMEAIVIAMQYSAEDLQERIKKADEEREKKRAEEKRQQALKKQQQEEARLAARSDEEKLADKLKAEASELYKNRQFEAAYSKFKEAAEINTKDLLLINNAAASLLEMERYDEALSLCDEALAKRYEVRAPFDVVGKIWGRKGAIYMRQKKYKEAVVAYEKAIVEDNNRVLRTSLADAQRALSKFEAESYLDPEKSEVHRLKGNDHYKNKNWVEAKKDYDEAIKRNPNNPALYTNRSATWMKLLEYPSALKDADQALKLDPVNVKGFLRKGYAHFHLKEFNKAMQAFQQGLQLQPDNGELREGLEMTLMKIDMNMRSGEVDQEQIQHAMADPEVQQILQDPQFQMVLQQIKENPHSAQQFMRDPKIAAGISKLMAAGIIRG